MWRTPAVLRAEIEHVRVALSETVDALAARPDVEALARAAIGEAGGAGPGTRLAAPPPGLASPGGLASPPGLASPAGSAKRAGLAQARYTELAYRAGRSRERLSGTIGGRWPVLAAAGSFVLLLAGLTVRRRRG
jgi:hypothetical protein